VNASNHADRRQLDNGAQAVARELDIAGTCVTRCAHRGSAASRPLSQARARAAAPGKNAAARKRGWRVDYQPFPHYAAAVWLMTQLRRWNMLKQEIDYKKLAEQVMLATDASRVMRENGASPPPVGFGKEIILGTEFDSSKPDDYLKSVGKG
jgi:hypothetical protein